MRKVRVTFGTLDASGRHASIVETYDLDNAADAEAFRRNAQELRWPVYSIVPAEEAAP